jgi:hypothetical protein
MARITSIAQDYAVGADVLRQGQNRAADPLGHYLQLARSLPASPSGPGRDVDQLGGPNH